MGLNTDGGALEFYNDIHPQEGDIYRLPDYFSIEMKETEILITEVDKENIWNCELESYEKDHRCRTFPIAIAWWEEDFKKAKFIKNIELIGLNEIVILWC